MGKIFKEMIPIYAEVLKNQSITIHISTRKILQKKMIRKECAEKKLFGLLISLVQMCRQKFGNIFLIYKRKFFPFTINFTDFLSKEKQKLVIAACQT